MFDIDLLNYDPNTPSFYVILITALFAFILSSLIAITYEYTTKSIHKRAHFLQSLALIGITASVVMQAIGDSVARGLGMLGALSIIRFRTVLNDPRNITFMFASLAAGIAAGVLGYSIALTGTLVFCLAAIILRFSPLHHDNELIGELRIQVPKGDEARAIIENVFKKHCRNFELQQMRSLNPRKIKTIDEEGLEVEEIISRQHLQEFNYLIRMKKPNALTLFTHDLNQLEGLENMRLNFAKQDPNL